jgi:Porin subfamily
MRTILSITAVVLLLASPVAAEQTRPLKFDQPADTKGDAKTLPVKPPKYDSSCAAYGAGFYKVEGTSTCVHIGGSISVGAGTQIRH